MKDVGKRQYVQRRGAVLWFRRKYPEDVVGKIVGGRALGAVFRKSLRVRSYPEVDKPLLEALSEFDRRVEAARTSGKIRLAKPPPIQHEALPTQSLSQIQDDDLVPILSPWFFRQWGKSPKSSDGNENIEDADECETEANAYLNPNDTSAASAIQQLAEVELARLGYVPDRKHPRFSDVADLMARARAAVLRRDATIFDPTRRARIQIDDPEVRQLVNAFEARSHRGRQGARSFNELLVVFMQDRQAKALSPATRREDAVLQRVIRELVGADTRLADVSPERCMEIRDLITRLPTNYAKHYRGRRLKDMPDLAKRDGRQVMSRKTANKYIEFLGAVFKFARKRLKWIEENPAEGLRLNIDKTIDRHYLPYTKDELSKLFRAPIFTGCKDAGRGAMRRGKLVPRKSVRYWAPLIALYSGMRSNEICQLDAKDIQIQNGHAVLLLRASEDKRVKTVSSRRMVPLHPELVRLGLVRLAQDREKKGEKKLFYDTRRSVTGYYSDPFQKWFSRLLTHTQLKRERLGFHSFRGTFKDALINAGVPEPEAEVLGGWSGDHLMVRMYGAGPTFKRLCRAVAKANFGRVIAHLKPYSSGRSKPAK